MCVDYRALIRLTLKNQCPIPRTDDMLDRLQGSNVFSSLGYANLVGPLTNLLRKGAAFSHLTLTPCAFLLGRTIWGF